MEVSFNLFMFNIFPWIVLIGLAFYGLLLKIDRLERHTLQNIEQILNALENSVEIDQEDNNGDDTEGDDDTSIPEDNNGFPMSKPKNFEDFSDEDSNSILYPDQN